MNKTSQPKRGRPKKPYNRDDLHTFNQVIKQMHSPNQMERIEARIVYLKLKHKYPKPILAQMAKDLNIIL